MNNPNSQSQNPNIENPNASVNNFLTEYLKNNPNTMIQQDNASNASESNPILVNAFEPQAAALNKKDSKINFPQNQMLANIISSNAPLINGINGINGLLEAQGTKQPEIPKSSALSEKAEDKAPASQSFADFAQFVQGQNYTLLFEQSRNLLEEKQIIGGGGHANAGESKEFNNACFANVSQENNNIGNAANVNSGIINNSNSYSNNAGCNPSCSSGNEEAERKESEKSALNNANFSAYAQATQGNFNFGINEANNPNNKNKNNINKTNDSNQNQNQNKNQINFPFNNNMLMNNNNNPNINSNLNAGNLERAAAAAQANNMNSIENLIKMNNSFTNQKQSQSNANNPNFPFNFMQNQIQNQSMPNNNNNNNNNILNILNLLMNNNNKNNNNNQNKPNFPPQIDPKILNTLLTSNPNNPLTQNLIQSLMQNNQKQNPPSAFNNLSNIPIPFNLGSNSNNSIINNVAGGANPNNPLSFINSLGNICKTNNNNLNNLNNNFNNVNSNPELTHNSLSAAANITGNKEISAANKLPEEKQISNTPNKQALTATNLNQNSNNDASVKSNNANNFNNNAPEVNFNVNLNANRNQNIPNPNFLMELLSKNMMNNNNNNPAKDKDANVNSNNANLINSLIQSQMIKSQGSIAGNNPLADLMNNALNNNPSNVTNNNNNANFLSNLGPNFNPRMLLNSNQSSNNANQNLNNLNILQKLLGMASNNINHNANVNAKKNPIASATNTNPNSNTNQSLIDNLNNLKSFNNLNNLQQSSNSNFTNMSSHPLLGLLSLIGGGNNQKATNSNQINQNTNTNNNDNTNPNNIHNNNNNENSSSNLLNTSLINSQITNSTSNQLKDIANTLPLLAANFQSQAAKAENSLSSPDTANKQVLNKQSGIQSIPPNLQNLLSLLSFSNEANKAAAEAAKGASAPNPSLMLKDENLNAKSAKAHQEINSFEAAANSLFKLNSSQNSVTNFNIFNNLFNIPALNNYAKQGVSGINGKNHVEEFKNSLLNISALNNLVNNKGQSNSASAAAASNANLSMNNINNNNNKNNQNASGQFAVNNINNNNAVNGIFAINNTANSAGKGKINAAQAANLAGLLQNNKIFNNFNTANNNNNFSNNLNNFNNINNVKNTQNNINNNNPNNINSLNSLANQLQGNNLMHKHFKATPGNPNELKHFSTNAQNSLSNIQNNLSNFSDKQQQQQQQQQQNYVKQVKYPIEDTELVKDPRVYAIDPKVFVRPEAKKIEIEQNLLKKIIVVWDFLTNFNKLVNVDEQILSMNFFDFFNKISCNSFYIAPPKEQQEAKQSGEVENQMDLEMQAEEENNEQKPKEEAEEKNKQLQESETSEKVAESQTKQKTTEGEVQENEQIFDNKNTKKEFLVLNLNENYEIFETLLIQLSKLFSNSLKDSDITDDVKVDKDLFIIKFCSENNFSDIESFYSKCYPEILRILVNSKRFGLMANEKVKTCVYKRLKTLVTEERIEILFYLVNSAFDLTSIKQQIKYESDLRNDLLRERNTLDYELKTKENRKREIEKMEKFITAPVKIELLTDRINKLDENPEEILKIYKETNVTKLKKDLDVERERYKGLIKENEELGNVRAKIMTRLDEIRTELNNLNLRNKKKIGQDYKKNDYYVFEKIPNYLFVFNKSQNFKPGLGFINSDNLVYIGFWGFYDSFDEVVLISNCLTEKGIREKILKSALKKLISKKFFSSESNDDLQESNLFTLLNEKYKELNLEQIPIKDLELNFDSENNSNNNIWEIEKNNNKQEKSNEKDEIKNNNNEMDLELISFKEEKEQEIKNEQEPDKANTAVNADDNQAEKTEANINNNVNLNNSNSIENINEIENQNKMLNEIIDDIQNIDNLKNDLDNILENEAHMDLIQDDLMKVEKLKYQNVIQNKKLEENKNNNAEKTSEKAEAEFAEKAQASKEGNAKSINDKLEKQEFNSKIDNYNFEKNKAESKKETKEKVDVRDTKMQVDFEQPQLQEKYFESEKDLEDLCGLKDKLLAMEEKFSEYLKQYEKEWDSPARRVEWRKFIEENYQFYNLFSSIKMLNFRFKNPYRSDEPPAFDEELNHEDDPSFIFKGKSCDSFKIFEFDKTRLLAPKVKIWSRDLEANEIEKYFSEIILDKIDNLANLYIAYFLFEGAVYGLIKRRDPYKRSNVRDNMGLDFTYLNYGSSSQQFNYNNNNEETLNRRSDSINIGKNEIDYFDNNAADNQEEADKNITEKQTIQSFNTTNNINNNNCNNIANRNTTQNASSRTRSTRLINPVNYNLNYNLNTIFNQAGLSNEAIRAGGKTSKPKTKADKQNKESFNDESKLANLNESDINTENNNKYLEDDNIDETLSDNNILKRTKKKKTNVFGSKVIKKKMVKATSCSNTNYDIKNDIDENLENAANEYAVNDNNNNNNLSLQEGNEKTDTLSDNFSEDEAEKKPSNNINLSNANKNKNAKKASAAAKNSNNANNKKYSGKKLISNKRKRIQDEELLEKEISAQSPPAEEDEEDYSESVGKVNKGAKNAKKVTNVNTKIKIVSAAVAAAKNNNSKKKSSDANLVENNKMDIDDDNQAEESENPKASNKARKDSENEFNTNNNSEALEAAAEENENENFESNKIIKNSSTNAKSKNTKKDSNVLNENEELAEYNQNLNKATNKNGKTVSRYLNKSAAAAEEEGNAASAVKGKRVTRSTNNEVIKGKWKEKCYICFLFGDLLCCEECSNVAHKFCACVDKIPEKWYCQKCLEKNRNKKE